MAFKSITIRQTTNIDRPMVGVFDAVYSGRLRFTSKHNSSELSINELPKGKGFSYDMQPPYVDFKTLRAMLNAGLTSPAKDVINTTTRSWITPDFVYDNLLNYCYPAVSRFECPVYDQVLKELVVQLRTDLKLQPLTLEEGVKEIPQSTSPGLPYIQLYPGKKKSDILQTHFASIKKGWDKIAMRKGVLLSDCAAFARSHIGKADENKVRPV